MPNDGDPALLFPKVQKRLDTALPQIVQLIEEFREREPGEKVGDAPLRALAGALALARKILSREPGTIASRLFYRDGTTTADAILLLRHARESLRTFAHRYYYKARW